MALAIPSDQPFLAPPGAQYFVMKLYGQEVRVKSVET